MLDLEELTFGGQVIHLRATALLCSHCAGRDLQKLYTHDTEEIKKKTARIFSRLVDK